MKLNKLTMLALGAALSMGFTACNDDDITVVNYGDPVSVTGAPLSGASEVSVSTTDIKVNFNTDVTVANLSKIVVNDIVPDSVSVDGSELLIYMAGGLNPESEYTVALYPYSVQAADASLHSFLEQTYTFSFTTGKAFYFDPSLISRNLVNPNATAAAKKVYSFLLDNYGSKTLTGAMGGVAWETGYSDFIASKAGKYPAIVGFDYIHFRSSEEGANWINYRDITPVKQAWEAGSIPAFSWHWLMPEVDATSSDEETATFENVIFSDSFDGQGWGNWRDIPTAGWAENLKEGEYLIFKSKAGGALGMALEDWSGKVGNIDFFEGTGNIVYLLDAQSIADLQSNATIHLGGTAVVTAMIHADSPALEPKMTYVYNGSFSPSAALTAGTKENAELNANIAVIAGYLELLQQEGIPVLWRPLHEAAGDYSWGTWFWWGNDGVEVTKQLWIYLYEQLTNVYHINNLIWVWTMQSYDNGALATDPSKLAAAYPGDAYVDIVGVDSYEQTTGVDITAQHRLVATAIGQHKLLALSEIGNLIDFESAMANDAPWSFFMNWYNMNEYGEWSIDTDDAIASNTRKGWRNVVNLPFMLSRGEFSVK